MFVYMLFMLFNDIIKKHQHGVMLRVDPSKTHTQRRTQDFLKGARYFFRIPIVASRVRNINLTQAHYRAAGFLSPPT